MSSQEDPDKVVQFPKDGKRDDPKRSTSSVEKIWGKDITRHGYVGVPSILIRAQRRLGLNSTQLNIIVQLLEYWRDPVRKPFPSKQEIADRVGLGPKAIQVNMRALEQAGLLRREIRKTQSGDYNSNIYHLDGLVERVRALEPEFQAVREAREKAIRDAKAAETPAGLRATRARGGQSR